MTSPDAAFEAALPESSAHPWLRGHGDPQYTIDQMRAMFDSGWQAALASREAEIDGSLADTVAAAIRNTCSMPHPNIKLGDDLKPYIWSLSYEANNQQAKARRLEAEIAQLREDARRYRWLRDVDDDPIGLRAVWTDDLGTKQEVANKVDTAIDAAIDQEKP